MDAKNNAERTALHCACYEAHADIVQMLLDFRALDSCVDINGCVLWSS